ncbi:MAG: alpha/beta fold hydrolase, partial [Chloroflexota bacterium]
MIVRSPDGTTIAATSSGEGPPLILVHGATADHTAFRVVGPRLAHTFTVHAIDRRGRGESGDGPKYAIEREFEDVAAVAERLANDAGIPVDVFGHSYGGRCALGAALLTDSIRRVVSYEGAPTPPGASYHPTGIEARLRERLAAGDQDGALATFLTEVVGMPAADLAAYQADPIWPVR